MHDQNRRTSPNMSEPNKDERICAVCGGGPGNKGVCLCELRAYGPPKPASDLPEETWASGEGPQCPFCAAVMTADDPEYHDESGFETECSSCGNVIRIQPHISINWQTVAVRRRNSP